MRTPRLKDIKAIWLQKTVPVIYRPPDKGALLLKIPYAAMNYDWLRNNRNRKPKWLEKYKCWVIPRSWFNESINRVLKKYFRLYIIQPYREQEKCAPACWNATGHECQCSCMGANHGQSQPGGNWFVVSESFATRWHDHELACRLLILKA